MFDFFQRPPAWPGSLRPINEGESSKELFEEWWARHHNLLAHLPSQLVEQWVHRHWHHSEFAFLPLDTLEWSLVSVSGDEILKTVQREISPQMDPDWDYEAFQGRHGEPKLQTAHALDQGTWDYPIIALSTPSGWKPGHQDFPDARLMLVEGHLRHRYLNALHHKGIAPCGLHKMFIISSPLVS